MYVKRQDWLIGDLANAVLAVRWIASCISDLDPWANIHLHLSGSKFPPSPTHAFHQSSALTSS